MPESVDLVFYENAKDNVPKPLTLSLENLVDNFRKHDRTECKCDSRTPAGKKHRCRAKDSYAFSPGIVAPNQTRGLKNTTAVSLCVFDVDHVTEDEAAGVFERIDASGLRVLAYSSHSHSPANDDWCLRLIFFPDRHMKPVEYKHVRSALVKRFSINADPAAKDASRLYYMPSAPVGAKTYFEYTGTLRVDVDAVLREEAISQKDRPSPPEAAQDVPAGHVDLELLRRFMRAYRPAIDDSEADWKHELVLNALQGKVLAPEGSRDTSVHRLACILATIFPANIGPEVAVELAYQSIAGMDGDEGVEHWVGKFVRSYEKSKESRAEFIEKKREENAAIKEAVSKRLGWEPSSPDEQEPEASKAPDEAKAPANEETEEEKEDPNKDWEQMLIWKVTDKSSFVVACGFNAYVYLKFDPAWRNVLRFNEATKKVEVHGGPLGVNQRDAAHLPTNIANWLHSQKDIDINSKEVAKQIGAVAFEQRYDPLKSYLEGLKWDGTSRIEDFLINNCDAVTESDGEDITEHIRKMSKRWFIGAVARGLNPGCKLDTVLVLEGEQGVKKSTTFEVLAGEFFCASEVHIGDKDAKMHASRSWVIELAELASLKRSESESQKAFFSTRIDSYRPPYGDAVMDFPRRCAFVGTTNKDEFLADDTGNRRYWAVSCGTEIDLARTRRERNQVWAEAVVAYKAAFSCEECKPLIPYDSRCPEHRWWFDREEDKAQDRINSAKLVGGVTADQIASWWLRKAPEDRPAFVRTFDIAVDVLEVAVDRAEGANTRVGRALKRLGFTRVQKRAGGIRFWAYEPSKKLKEAPKTVTSGSRTMTVVKGGADNERDEGRKEEVHTRN